MRKTISLSIFMLLTYLICVSAGSLQVTPEHPFLLNGSWIEAQDLEEGDILKTLTGNSVIITNIRYTKLDEPILVYNLEANPYHDFIIDGLIVHNSNVPKEFGAFHKASVKYLEGIGYYDEVIDNRIIIQRTARTNVRNVHWMPGEMDNPAHTYAKFRSKVTSNPQIKYVGKTPSPVVHELADGLQGAFARKGWQVSLTDYTPTQTELARYARRARKGYYQAPAGWKKIEIWNPSAFDPHAGKFDHNVLSPAYKPALVALSYEVGYGLGGALFDSLYDYANEENQQLTH